MSDKPPEVIRRSAELVSKSYHALPNSLQGSAQADLLNRVGSLYLKGEAMLPNGTTQALNAEGLAGARELGLKTRVNQHALPPVFTKGDIDQIWRGVNSRWGVELPSHKKILADHVLGTLSRQKLPIAVAAVIGGLFGAGSVRKKRKRLKEIQNG